MHSAHLAVVTAMLLGLGGRLAFMPPLHLAVYDLMFKTRVSTFGPAKSRTGQNTRPNDFRLRTLQDTAHRHIPLLCTSRPQCNPTLHCTSTPITTTSANAKINMDITSALACTSHCPPHEHQDTLSTIPPSPALASIHISRHQTRAPWTCRKRAPLRQPCTCTASPICFVIVQSQRLAYLILLVWLDVPSLLGPLRSVQSSLICGN
jgi:hypothetical protein